MSKKFLIWSNEHHAWWRPNSAGYTIDRAKAGRYEEEEADGICSIRRTFSGKPGEEKRPLEPIDYAVEWAEVGPELLETLGNVLDTIGALSNPHELISHGVVENGEECDKIMSLIAKAREIGK